ncbi:MAG: rRNA pseudouridine synthase [Chloroflexi bacterium]|nr:rRNA pseudouridine synthase [Chloroflexota bacterium]
MMERLQKILAHAGIASRRKAEEIILAGRVLVNGQIVNTLGSKVDPARDRIVVDGKTIRAEVKKYIVLYKPKGYLSDLDEERGKPLAVDLVDAGERLYPVGRLDAQSEGLLLLTNDGDVALRLSHPRYQHAKEYLVLVRGEPDDRAFAAWRRGVVYEGERYKADRAGRAASKQKFGAAPRGQAWIKMVLHEGKKREIRNMCAVLGHPVTRLIRIRLGPILLGDLRAGEWRELSAAQVRDLKQGERKEKAD